MIEILLRVRRYKVNTEWNISKRTKVKLANSKCQQTRLWLKVNGMFSQLNDHCGLFCFLFLLNYLHLFLVQSKVPFAQVHLRLYNSSLDFE